MATVDFGSTKGAYDVLRMGPPYYGMTIAGPPDISARLETVTIPHKAGKLLVGDGLLDDAMLLVTGKIFLANRAALDSAVYSIWSTLYAAGAHWVSMSDGTYNYPVRLKNCSGEFLPDTADKWGNLTITLLILDPTLIAT